MPIFRPLDHWSRKQTPEHQRKSRFWFKAGWESTLALLGDELDKIKARDTVIQVDCDESMIRNDGYPRSDARVGSPRVAISFQSVHGALSYYCDDFVFWQHNVRAIAMTLQRLREADMYGATKTGEQYRGFRQLPGGIEMPAALTPDDAADFIAEEAYSGVSLMMKMKGRVAILGTPDGARHFYQLAAKRLHPDAGGEGAGWNLLQAAWAIVAEHHKIK